MGCTVQAKFDATGEVLVREQKLFLHGRLASESLVRIPITRLGDFA